MHPAKRDGAGLSMPDAHKLKAGRADLLRHLAQPAALVLSLEDPLGGEL
jgi:hypothetical protein